MSAVITPTERAMIDKALKAGKVTKVAIGTSAFEREIIWDGKVGRLKYVDVEMAKSVLRTSGWSQEYGIKFYAMCARRSKVRRFMDGGATVAQIATKLNKPLRMIQEDVRVITAREEKAHA